MDLVIIGFLVLIVILTAGGLLIKTRNDFVRQADVVEESWQQVDAELRRWHALVDELLRVVGDTERVDYQALERVRQAHSVAVASRGTGPMQQGRAEQQLGRALSVFFAEAESNPVLRNLQQFQDVQDRLVKGADAIAQGGRFYNDAVREYHARFSTFPSNLVSGNFDRTEFFEVDAAALAESGHPPQQQTGPIVS
jgi:LemA protein